MRHPTHSPLHRGHTDTGLHKVRHVVPFCTDGFDCCRLHTISWDLEVSRPFRAFQIGSVVSKCGGRRLVEQGIWSLLSLPSSPPSPTTSTCCCWPGGGEQNRRLSPSLPRSPAGEGNNSKEIRNMCHRVTIGRHWFTGS